MGVIKKVCVKVSYLALVGLRVSAEFNKEAFKNKYSKQITIKTAMCLVKPFKCLLPVNHTHNVILHLFVICLK